MIFLLGVENNAPVERETEMKKVYERPVLRSVAIAFGVFGSYGDDDSGGGGGGGGHGRGRGRGGRGGRWWWW